VNHRPVNDPQSQDPSAEQRALVDALKRRLRQEGVTYAQLGARIGLSEPSVKRLFSQGRFSLQQLLACCSALDIELGALCQSRQARAAESRELGIAQEKALAADPRLLLLFHLLVQGWSLTDIAREYGFRGADRTLLLTRLDHLGLIELLPQDRVRLRIPRDFRWRTQGPVRRRYGAAVLQEFLLDRFQGERALLRFEVRELSEPSLHVLRRKMEKLAQEVAELAELDAYLPVERKHSVGVAMALRPWVFSVAAALRQATEDSNKASQPAARRPRR
jgi:transcriptional regulator with XRE-family HTH domain